MKSQSFTRVRMLGSTALPFIAIGLSAPAAAQAQERAQAVAAAPSAERGVEVAQAASLDEATAADIVVTGSRIQRSGFSAPTPTTVIGADDIKKAAPANIADFVNQLPQLSGSSTTRTGNGNTSAGTNGLNTLNLRSLGSNRTLVLLDGRRVVSSAVNGTVDINNLPSALIERVDVVTGGASAAYGSDAVAGVVNFLLQSKFTGIKGAVSGGITERGDDENFNASLAFGAPFASGRGHILLSIEGAYQAGIDTLDPSKRKWFSQTNMLTNPAYTPTNGQPRRIVSNNVNTLLIAQGGVITSTALANTQFGVGGTPAPFVRGSVISDPFMIGGNSWTEGNLVALDSGLKRWTGFGRATYDLTDDITFTGEASYGYSRTTGLAAYQRYSGNLTVSATNPYLPASIRTQAAALGISSFRYGYSSYDLGRPENDATRQTYRAVAALDGKFANDRWKWNAYYQFGQTDTKSLLLNTTNVARFAEATDAVTNTAGQIVCRSTLTAPSNGCVPLNIFGIGVANPAAVQYVKGVATQNLSLKQNVAAASISGEPFTLWAGPVSVATGIEYRKEEVSGTGDAISLANGWYTGNFKGTNGSYDVKEGFVEVVIPLAHDMTLLRSLEFNGAARYTDYSTSGGVTTWKAGLTYSPVAGLILRGVRSRDIRAPNLSELYLAGQTQAQDVNDPFNNLALVRMQRVTVGNTDLRPEKADTTSFGIVYTPPFLRRFSASVDYYKIDLGGAITTLANQEIADRCFRGETAICQYIIRNSAGTITQLIAKPINVATLKTRGLDIEASFRQPLNEIISSLDGTLTIRALGSHIAKRTTISGGVSTEAAGQNTADAPKWRWLGTVSIDTPHNSFTLTMRGISAGVYDNLWTSGVDIDNNRIKGANYFDLALSHRFQTEPRRQLEVFAKIENLFDKDPPVVASNAISGLQTNPILYDVIGRAYRVGARFRY
jgi:outer membrane receptor protein involved in Fe transport